MELKTGLLKYGLKENESKIYLELARCGSVSGSELAKALGMDRPLTYNILNKLVEKGLAAYVKKEHKRHFSITDPKNLLNQIREKEFLLSSIIPQIQNIRKIPKIRQEINVLEGQNGIKSLWEDLINYDRVCCMNATGTMYKLMPYYLKELERRSKGSKKEIKIIASQGVEIKKSSHVKLLAKFLPKKYSNSSTYFVYGQKVAFQIVVLEKPLVIVIENKIIADGMKKDFDFMWDNL